MLTLLSPHIADTTLPGVAGRANELGAVDVAQQALARMQSVVVTQ